MDSSDLNEIPSVRLASGVEMQQRWPQNDGQQLQQQQQKSTEPPRLIEMAPTCGSQGTVVTVVVQSLPHQLVPVKLAFNSLVVDTKQMQAQGITSLVAAVPPFQQTHSTTANVPISICILDKDSVTETWPVAEFIYEFDNKDATANTTPTLTSASTSSSNETSTLDYATTEKRNDIQSAGDYQTRENFLGGSTNTTYENFYQQPVNNYNNLTNQQMPQYSYAYNENKYTAFRPNNSVRATAPQQQQQQQQQQPMTSYNSNAGINLFNPNNANFGLASFDQNEPAVSLPTSANTIGYSAQSPMTNSPNRLQTQMVTPQRQTSYGYGKSSVHVPATSVANYQPYPGLVSRANLKIAGDLDSMAKNWAPEEWEHRRRLVQFWREQNSNEIRCTFGPVAQGERITSNSGHIVVSCIYWAERNDCFITSVDCIHLLESLMDIRFSVEEKNRVRRNLEGFRPLTVSKCKAESAEFFKLIMSFPNPKPRNIEKDVKVFPWKTLPYALKKIVTKYTASSYNTNSGAQQRRAQLTKSTVPTPPVVTPPIMNHNASSYMTASSTQPQQQPQQSLVGQEGMNNFYQTQNNMYQQPQYNSYHTQQHSNEQQTPVSTLYQNTPSVPAYASTYTQSQHTGTTSPAMNNSPSPRLQYSYSSMMNASDAGNASSTSSSHETAAPRRASLTNRQDFSIL
ncbi:unnamed protein product [Mucor hiemalis]